jgi:hypothetical protein
VGKLMFLLLSTYTVLCLVVASLKLPYWNSGSFSFWRCDDEVRGLGKRGGIGERGCRGWLVVMEGIRRLKRYLLVLCSCRWGNWYECFPLLLMSHKVFMS